MNMKLAWLIGSVLSLAAFSAKAQPEDTPKCQAPKFGFGAFADVFWAYDFNQPSSEKRQPFFYNYNRHQEFNLNFGYIKFFTEHEAYRANLALHAGTYVNDNYADEPGVLKNIFEANVGMALSKPHNLWLDAGIFASHIGFESAVSLDNWTLTRSILAENSPYYLSGVKITHTPSRRWEWAVLVCNGWQRLQKVKGSSIPALGTQLKWTPAEHLLFNWSTFLGTNDPDSTRRMRYYNNLFGQIQLAQKLGLIVGFDIGAQQVEKQSSDYHLWFSPVGMLRYSFHEKWATTFRAEYYQDAHAVIIPTDVPGGFKTSACSINLDYLPVQHVAARIEGRLLLSDEKIFERSQVPVKGNFTLVASIAIRY